jgi:uncharacterized membrane protein
MTGKPAFSRGLRLGSPREALWISATLGGVSISLLGFACLAAIIPEMMPDGFLTAVFSRSCHQMPSRCYQWNGDAMLICARCVGVHLGFAIASVATLRARGVIPRWLAASAMPFTCIAVGDWLLSWLFIPSGWRVERTVTGMFGGMGVFVFACGVLPFAPRLVYQLVLKSRHHWCMCRALQQCKNSDDTTTSELPNQHLHFTSLSRRK